MYDNYAALKIEARGPSLWLVMDNPPVNASSPELRDDLDRIFREVSRDPEVRCVVITGAGDKFSAGGDVNRMKRMVDDHAEWLLTMIEARNLVMDMLDCDKPIIGRINGDALGLGATIALCCDITIMDNEARIGDTHVKMGLVAGDGGSLLWPYLVGLMQTRKHLLTGDLLTGREAAEIGLVTASISGKGLDDEVSRWESKFTNGATQAIVGTKRALNLRLRQDAAAFMDAHLGLETMSHLSQDHREAVSAFLEKRKTKFCGR